MSLILAGLIYRWRYPLSAAIVLGALALAPRADITKIDNDVTAWFSRDDPVYRDYERFREEFAGTRSLIVALQADSADRLFARDTLETIAAITDDIERVDTVQQVYSLATATIVQALPAGKARLKPDTTGTERPDSSSVRLQPDQTEDDDGGIEVAPSSRIWRRAIRRTFGGARSEMTSSAATWYRKTRGRPPSSSASTKTASTTSAPA